MLKKMVIAKEQAFIGLSVGLTLISLYSGWLLYEAVFGLSMAVLISFIFELLRLSTLYSLNIFSDKFYKGIALFLYIMIAFICFSASVLSFNSRIIKSEDEHKATVNKAMAGDIYLIKSAFSKQIEEQIKAVEKHKTQMQQALGQYPASKVYPEKIKIDDEKILELTDKRQAFFDSVKDSDVPAEWIANQKAILGIEKGNSVYENINSPVARAAKEFFGISEPSLQKSAGVLLTIAIEVGIIILMLLGTAAKNIGLLKPTKKIKIKLKKPIIAEEEAFEAKEDITKRKPKREKSSLVDNL